MGKYWTLSPLGPDKTRMFTIIISCQYFTIGLSHKTCKERKGKNKSVYSWMTWFCIQKIWKNPQIQENWMKDQYTKIIIIYVSKIGKWNSLNIAYISIKNQILRNKFYKRCTSILNYKTLLRVVKDLKLWRMRESARQRTSSQVGSLNMSVLLTWGGCARTHANV